MATTSLRAACIAAALASAKSLRATSLGSFACRGELTAGPGFLSAAGDALIVSRFTGDPLESDDVATAAGFAARLLAGDVSTAACARVAQLTWPNDVEAVALPLGGGGGGGGGGGAAVFQGLLAPGGFLVPPKTVGAVTLLNGSSPGAAALTLSAPKVLPGDGWFYHRATPVDVDGDGLVDILAARAVKPLLGAATGELVWMRQPAVAAPLAPAALPWAEAVLVAGAWAPDVLFAPPVSLRGDADAQLLYTSFFTGGGLCLLQCAGCAAPGGASTWARAHLTPTVLDATIGPAFDVAAVDLNGDGRLDALVTNHVDNATAINGTVYQSLVLAYEAPPAPVDITNASAWRRHVLASGFAVREPGPNQAAPGAARAFAPPGNPGGKPWISVAGDGDQRAYVLTPASADPLNWSYTRTLVHDCAGTVGRQLSFALAGRTFLVIPCYDAGTIVAYELEN